MRVVVIVMGPSGVGKDTLINLVAGMVPDLQIGMSLTTRPPRADDTKYHYAKSYQELHARFLAGELLEENEIYPGQWSGKFVPPADGLCILEMDVEGAEAAKAKLPDAIKVLIVPPKPWDLHLRMRLDESRPNLSPTDRAQRLKRASYEIEYATKHHPDFVITNGNLKGAAEELANIIWQAQECARQS